VTLDTQYTCTEEEGLNQNMGQPQQPIPPTGYEALGQWHVHLIGGRDSSTGRVTVVWSRSIGVIPPPSPDRVYDGG
jgi:hypothetical protein